MTIKFEVGQTVELLDGNEAIIDEVNEDKLELVVISNGESYSRMFHEVSAKAIDNAAYVAILQSAKNGYIAALFWADGSEEEDQFYGCNDVPFSEELDAALDAHISKFIDNNYGDIAEYVREHTFSNLGHDMCLTEMGHGTGFWDRNLGKAGERMTQFCADNDLTKFLEVDDNNTICVHPFYYKQVKV